MATKTVERKGDIEYSVETLDKKEGYSLIVRKERDDVESVAKYDPKSGIVEMLPQKEDFKQMVINHLNNKGLKFTEIAKIGTDLKETVKGAPKKPKKSRKRGQKTPGLVDWYARYQPDVFLSKYAVKQMQVLKKIEKHKRKVRNDQGVQVDELYEIYVYQDVDGFDYDVDLILAKKQRLIAGAQTHLTHKVKDDSDSDDYDDSLDDDEDEGDGYS